MKKILIVNNNMHIGGVQKALLNLLCEIKDDYDITLLLFYKGGKLLDKIPPEIKVEEAVSLFRYIGMTSSDTKSAADRMLRRFFAALTRIFGIKFVLELMYPSQKHIGKYDIAISFLHSGNNHTFYGGCNEFVLKCVEAERKITFLHCDFGKIGAASEYNKRIYGQFDKIAACSEGCKNAFLNVMPQLSENVAVVKNCINYDEVRKAAREEKIIMSDKRVNVVTVSRLGKEKGVLRAINAFIKLSESGKDFAYYIIGSGTEYAKAKNEAEKSGLGDKIFMLGELKNPYGYISQADFLLIPSYSEAAPMVINEAACLGVPVLTTETSSAYEMAEKTGIGWVCPNSDEGIISEIGYLLDNPKEIKDKKTHIKNIDFSDREALKEFSELVLCYANKCI